MKMPLWMKKSVVVLLSIMTLGLVSPNDFYWFDEAKATKPDSDKALENAVFEENSIAAPSVYIESDHETVEIDERTRLLENLSEKAEQNSYIKFGDRIGPRIEDEFTSIILPKMEEAIAAYVNECPDAELPYIAITEKPSSGLGEKIFNVYNSNTKENLILFHVRRENVPQEGHWFNFHYHTAADQFVAHHSLGSIYWDKNTPPHWGTKATTV
ncbi:MAG: YpjP family protein [Bacillus sp. (in: firmicutes)]